MNGTTIPMRLSALSLAQKFIALSSSLVLLTSMTVAVFVVRSETEESRADLVTHGRNTTELLAQNAEYALYTEDQASLLALLSVTEVDHDVAYLVITSREGRVLAQRGEIPPKGPSPAAPAVAIIGQTAHRSVVSPVDGRRYVEIVAPVRSPGTEQVLGHIRLGLSTAQVEQKVREFMATVAELTLLLVALAVGLAVVVARRIVRPIEYLRGVARDIGDGRFDVRVEGRGTAEIADLGRAFNAMLTRLRDSHDELKSRANELAAANAQMLDEIEERRKAEAALRESQERYALAARAANDGLWDWNLETGEVYFAPRWKAMLGLRDEEVGGRIEEWLDRVHPDDVKKLRGEIDDHLRGANDQLRSLYRMRHVDGARWMLCRGLAVRDALGRAVRLAGSQTDVTGQKLAEERLVHDALHDALTGLPNRALFTDRLHHALLRAAQGAARSKAGRFAVLFVDLDRFKLINDSLGHLVGDRLLVEVGRRISACLRPGDTAARFGGDEFAVLLEDLETVAGAESVARRLVERIAAPVMMDGKTFYTTASVGITLAGADPRSAEEILRDADIAMYRAKRLGGKYEVFDSSMHAETMDRMLIETDLRGALERGEFVVYYQPILRLEARRLTAFEALLRWRHPRRGLVSPAEFIPILEETRLIVPVGRWVLEEVCRQTKQWLAQGPENGDLKVSVNVSNVQFAHPSFGREVREALEAARLEPRHLALEITESVLMESPDTADRVLQELHELGVGIYLDDFGTGYSSLAYLPRFPIDSLKIDCSFVARMNHHRADMEVVRAIAAIAHNLGMGVIAEGIEKAEQVTSLLALPCELGQGWLYAPAVPADRASELLAQAGSAFLPAPAPFAAPGLTG